MRSLCVVLLAACSEVFGLDPPPPPPAPDADLRPDRDGDGIADAEDPCIAGSSELALDYDGDALTTDDPCPFDAATADTDGDGLPDECDPFPDLAGDRIRCITTFTNSDLATSLWQARTGETAWTVYPGSIGSAFGEVRSSVAAERVDAPISTSFDVRGYHVHNSGDTGRILAFWLRGGSEPSSTDVWCALRSDNTESRLVVESAASPGAVTSPPGPAVLSSSTFRLRLTVEPEAGTVSCQIDLSGTLTTGTLVAAGRIPLPAGNFGFYAGNIFARVQRVSVLERDTPALP